MAKMMTEAEYVLDYGKHYPTVSIGSVIACYKQYLRDLLRTREVMADEVDEDPPADPALVGVRLGVVVHNPGHTIGVYVNGRFTPPGNLAPDTREALLQYLGVVFP